MKLAEQSYSPCHLLRHVGSRAWPTVVFRSFSLRSCIARRSKRRARREHEVLNVAEECDVALRYSR